MAENELATAGAAGFEGSRLTIGLKKESSISNIYDLDLSKKLNTSISFDVENTEGESD